MPEQDSLREAPLLRILVGWSRRGPLIFGRTALILAPEGGGLHVPPEPISWSGCGFLERLVSPASLNPIPSVGSDLGECGNLRLVVGGWWVVWLALLASLLFRGFAPWSL